MWQHPLWLQPARQLREECNAASKRRAKLRQRSPWWLLHQRRECGTAARPLMLYSLLHLLLLLGATLGVWLVRRRALLVIGGLLLFPLPAAMYNYFAAPVPAVVATLPDPTAPPDCTRDPTPPSAESSDAKADCASQGGPPRLQVLIVVLAVNYLTVFIAFTAGMLCRRPLARL